MPHAPHSGSYLFGLLFAVGALGLRLAKQQGSDIRIVSYLFSLAMICTILLKWWLDSLPNLPWSFYDRSDGGTGIDLLRHLSDMAVEIKVLGTVVAVVILPQLLSYALSGLVGCAATPILLGATFRFVFWSAIKFLVAASGIFAGLYVYAMFTWNWDIGGEEGTDLVFQELVTMDYSLAYLAIALFGMIVYRAVASSLTEIGERSPRKIRLALRRVHSWANRRMRVPTGRPPSNAATSHADQAK